MVIEGIIDLLYLDHDGQMVILDYKSDRVDTDAAVQDKMDYYRWQGAAYAAAVESATGKTVKDVQFLFVRRDEARPGSRLTGTDGAVAADGRREATAFSIACVRALDCVMFAARFRLIERKT